MISTVDLTRTNPQLSNSDVQVTNIEDKFATLVFIFSHFRIDMVRKYYFGMELEAWRAFSAAIANAHKNEQKSAGNGSHHVPTSCRGHVILF